MKDIRKFLQQALSLFTIVLLVFWIVAVLLAVIKAFELFYPTASSVLWWLNISFILIYLINLTIKK